MIITERLSEIDKMHLDAGNHKSLEKGACVMELVSYIAG